MRSESDRCDSSRLERLVRDRLSGAEEAALDAHLERCASCRRELENLAAEKTWWSKLPAIARPFERWDGGDSSAREEIDGGLQDKEGASGRSESLADDHFVRALLGPTEHPGSQGTLGPYEVTGMLGRGGMGIVLKGHDSALNRTVAIKILSPHLAASAAARRRFAREAKAAAAVAHEHVVAIHAVDSWKGLPYLVMPYIAGVSLQHRIDQDGPLKTEEILRIGLQTASGLAAAHGQGLVHRDIKPANILLENGVERVKITDFGLARTADDASMTQSGVVAGTPQYMSPEQAKGDDVDARSDLFSLGSVMYAMGTGHPPFRAPSTMAVLRRVSGERPRPIREVNPECPPWLAAIVAKLHAKDPARRYPSAAVLADELKWYLAELQHGGPGALRCPPSDDIRAKSRHLRRSVMAGALILALICGIGAADSRGFPRAADFVATILRIRTPDGTLVVQIDDPTTKVEVDGKTLVITGAGVREIRLSPGSHHVRATKDGTPVLEELVSITRGGKQTVKVSRESTNPAPGVADLPALKGRPGPAREKATQNWFFPDLVIGVSPGGEQATTGSPSPRSRANRPGERMYLATRPPKPVAESEPTPEDAGNIPFRSPIQVSGGGVVLDVPQGVPFKPTYTLVGSQQGGTRFVRFAPDGRTVAMGGDDRVVRLWDVAAEKVRAELRGHVSEIHRALFAPDSKLLITSGQHQDLRMWGVANTLTKAAAEMLPSKDLENNGALALSPDGSILATADEENLVTLWDLASGKVRLSFRAQTARGRTPGHPRHQPVLPPRPEPEEPNPRDGQARFEPEEPEVHEPNAREIHERPKNLGTAVPHRDIKERRQGRGTTRRPAVNGLAFSRSGKLLAGAIGDSKSLDPGKVLVWDAETGAVLTTLVGQKYTVWNVEFTPDDRTLASASSDGTVKLWDVATWTERATLSSPMVYLWPMAISPDGRKLAAGLGNGVVSIWDLATAQPWVAFPAHAGLIYDVAFSPDGKALATAGWDSTVKLWTLSAIPQRTAVRPDAH